MKVRLIKPLFGRKEGSIVTMHPSNARAYAHMGICEAMTDKEQEYLNSPLPCRSKRVENQMWNKATDATIATPVMESKEEIPVHDEKPKRARRRKKL